MRALPAGLLCALLLAGCATRGAAPGKLVAEERVRQLVAPGRTTGAELLAAFGPTRTLSFDSGMQVWLYATDAGAGRYGELVLLLDGSGVVRKMRSRPPYPDDPPP